MPRLPFRRTGGALALLLLLTALPAAAGGEAQPTWPVELISSRPDGALSNNESQRPSLSADGRVVAFESLASDLVEGDTNGNYDVFVHDRDTGVTELVSVNSDGDQVDTAAWDPVMSADGNVVVFASDATNLAPGGPGPYFQLYAHDRRTGVTERVSETTDGALAEDFVTRPAISADGRFVVFDSLARNLDSRKSHSGWDVFLRDRELGTTEMISVSEDGTPSNTHVLMPDISDDGRYVVFHSASLLLAPTAATNSLVDVLLLDRQEQTLRKVSVGSDGRDGNWNSGWGNISGDGSVVAFRSQATNLVPETRRVHSLKWDIHVHDVASGRTERVSVSSTGAEATHPTGDRLALSRDGRYIAFDTNTPLTPDAGTSRGLYIHDRHNKATELVSRATTGEAASGTSWDVSLSADGRTVAYAGNGRGIVPGKTAVRFEVLVHERGPSLGAYDVEVVGNGDHRVVTGRALFEGQVVSEAAGPADPDPLVARAGGTLRAARVHARPHQDDLLVQLELEQLAGFRLDGIAGAFYCEFISCPNSMGGGPLTLYRLAFSVEGVPYEARAQRQWVEGNPFALPPRLELYRCDGDCEQVAELKGATGTTGEEILLSLPLDAFGLTPGARLTDMRAAVVLGHIDGDVLRELSEVDLPDATIPAASVEVVLPDGTAVAAERLPLHRFRATLSDAVAPDGPLELRACLGSECRTTPIGP